MKSFARDHTALELGLDSQCPGYHSSSFYMLYSLVKWLTPWAWLLYRHVLKSFYYLPAGRIWSSYLTTRYPQINISKIEVMVTPAS